ncbi:MAG: hypothetical protein OEY14_12370, partial [Myxococcales bacterium]|nr:hypothetical protein [Myxococcales bacterium]
AETREALTRDLVEEIAAEGPPRDEALEALPLEEVLDGVDAEFDRPHLHRRYQGLYTFPALTRMVTEREELANERGSLEPEGLLSRLGALYPPRISQMVEQAYELDKEIDALEALKLGFLEAPGGVIVHRGRQVRRRDLPELLAALHAERGERRQQLLQGFQEARGAHLAIARRLGGGWEGYLEALLGQLLFAEHTQAEILDARAHFRNIVAHALADGNVSRSEMRQLVEAGAELAADVDGIYSLRHAVRAPTPILERMQLESFAQAFPEKRGLFAPMEADFAQDWIGAAESWVNVLASAHGALAAVTLDHLLEIEEMLARCLREGSEPEPAPPRAESPSDFPRRPHGQERPKRLELGWWDAFQLAEGRGAAALRLGVALAVLAPAFLFSADLLGGELVIYNGLERRVRVHAGETELTLGPHRSERIDVPRGPLSLRTSTMQGEPIEALDVEIAGGNRTPLYNIGGAAPLIRWRATYGTAVETPPMTLGPIRWVGEPQEDYVLEEPPRTLSLSSGQRGATRSVLEPLEEDDAQEILWGVEDPEDREQLSSIHGRWDDLESPSLGVWLLSIGDPERRAQIVRERLEERGARAGAARVRLDRILLDSLPEEARRERCDALQAEAERAPADPRLAYLRIRCEAPSDAQDEAFAALASRFESDPWAALAAGHGYAERGAWSQADALLSSRSELLEWRELQIPLLIASIRRVMAAPGQPRLGDLPSRSAALARALAIEARAPQLQQIPICQAIWAIDDGELELAARTPGLTEAELVTVRLLAGSSRGASPELVAIALEQSAPLESLGAAWASLGLRLREGRDPGPVIERIGELAGPQAASLAASFNAPVLYADPYTLDAELIRVRPQLQALAKMAAMILLGDATPEPWRAVVEGFLFEHERPRL